MHILDMNTHCKQKPPSKRLAVTIASNEMQASLAGERIKEWGGHNDNDAKK